MKTKLLLIFLLAIGGSASAQLVLPICSVNLPCPGFPLGSVQAPIDQNGWRNFKVTLTSNVSSFSFVGIPPSPAQAAVNVIFTQDATGGRSVTFASNISNPCTVAAGSNTTTLCQFEYDGVAGVWFGVSAGGVTGSLLGWHRLGTVLPATLNADQFSTQEMNVITDVNGKVVAITTPQILTTTIAPVYGAYFSCGFATEGICYAETQDFINWYRFTLPNTPPSPLTNMSNHSGSCVLVNGTNLEIYAGTPSNGAGGETQIDQFTATLTAPTTITLAHSGVLTIGSAGQWDQTHLGNCGIRLEGSTRYMLYDATSNGSSWSMGEAQSTDGGVTWTKFAGNPLVTSKGSGRSFLKINGTYYTWIHAAPAGTGIPSDIYEYSSLAPTGPWTAMNGGACVVCRQTADEGPNSATGQAADAKVFEYNGSSFMTYEGNTNGNATGFHIKLLTAYGPLSIITPSSSVVVEPTAFDTTNPGTFLGQPGNWGGGLVTEYFKLSNVGNTDVGFLGANLYVAPDTGNLFRENTGAGAASIQLAASNLANSSFVLARVSNTSGANTAIYLASTDTNGNIFDSIGTYFGTNISTNTDPAHSLSCTASTVTYTFTGRYAHHPVCMCSDQTTAGGVKTTYTGTTSVTYTCPGASDAIDCMCIGKDLNP